VQDAISNRGGIYLNHVDFYPRSPQLVDVWLMSSYCLCEMSAGAACFGGENRQCEYRSDC